MQQYLDLMQDVLNNGKRKDDRTGTGTLSVFGRQMRFDLAQGFPLLTTKALHTKSIIHELLWFLRGDTNVEYLNDHGVTIWNDWVDEDGELGRTYGAQWRDFQGGSLNGVDMAHNSCDQIVDLIDGLRKNPNSRRHIVTAWHPCEVDDTNLPPCHILFQCDVTDDKLSLQVYQRSADLFLGVPFNIASYAFLTHMLAQQCDLDVGELIWTGGDVHLYSNHLDQARLQLERAPRALPRFRLQYAPSIDDYTLEHFRIEGYDPHPTIKAEISV